MIRYSDRVLTSTLSDLITSGQLKGNFCLRHKKKIKNYFHVEHLRPIKLRICHNQRFTKFITFIPSQQLTKLSDLLRESGDFLQEVSYNSYC